MTIASPDPRMVAEPWIRVFVGFIVDKNGTGPTKRNATAKNKFPVMETIVGYFILSQICNELK
jgi:hypothetical protein